MNSRKNFPSNGSASANILRRLPGTSPPQRPSAIQPKVLAASQRKPQTMARAVAQPDRVPDNNRLNMARPVHASPARPYGRPTAPAIQKSSLERSASKNIGAPAPQTANHATVRVVAPLSYRPPESPGAHPSPLRRSQPTPAAGQISRPNTGAGDNYGQLANIKKSQKPLPAPSITRPASQKVLQQHNFGKQSQVQLRKPNRTRIIHPNTIQRVIPWNASNGSQRMDRKTVPNTLITGGQLTPESITAWNRSAGRPGDSFIGVTNLNSGACNLFPCFTEDAGNPLNVTTIFGVTDTKANVNAVYHGREIIAPAVLFGGIDGYFHKQACAKAGVPETEAIGWAIPGSKNNTGANEIRFVSGRNLGKFEDRPTGLKGNGLAHNEVNMGGHIMTREARDLPKAWKQWIQGILVAGLNLTVTSDARDFSGTGSSSKKVEFTP